MARMEGVQRRIRELDAAMASVNRMCRKFGIPAGSEKDLSATKKAVGNLIDQMELSARRS
ncbi:hypothetical protein OOZ19_29755 [Saccharopolyspora sp. NFXS83]|uniref:hypothetical protein n=1 Tax=Saccharopolyspora sp. NFXS83 TaxID=2993560 RepID=UPI00224ABE1D|nr:hypothetical protein [Saccharopolyspora sp. NFXS83]MCX2734451.1 hypothetical protein [Saccharopolyspora sp. NFXS83]